MRYINTLIHVCVAFQVAFQGASGAILRGRTTSADSVQIPASNLDSLSLAAEDLDNQLDSFLRSWGGGHRKPDIVEIANIAKRQTGSIQISSEELQDLLRLIQSIAQQLAAIIESGGSSASGTVAPPTSSTVSTTAPVSNTAPVGSASEIAVPPVSNPVSNTGPVSSLPAPSDVQSTGAGTNPAATGVSAPTPSPFLTTSGADSSEHLTTIYATSVATTTRCKTTVTQTFTETVFEDGPSAVPRAVRAVVEDDDDDDDIDGPDPRSTNPVEQDDDWEPWVEFDGTTAEEDGSDVGFTPRDTWASLGVTRRSPAGVSPNVETLFSRDEETL
ncbi:hypothetical protein LY76DRAFT_277289 [Colletotrichum caudatum]|nr:hypothetical protein LY76DRAFT_277289 [Colletotrichum caudatum]